MAKRKSIIPVSENQLSFLEVTPFEQHKRTDENGQEFWTARELMILLGYIDWRNFSNVIALAKISCANVGYQIDWHFGVLTSTVQTGRGRKQEIEDFKLSRYACHLIAMNGDPSKLPIAEAQTYFSIKTREAELAQDKKSLKMEQDVTAYQLKGGKSAENAKSRVDAKEITKGVNGAEFKIHETNSPNYGKIAGEQTYALFDMSKKEIVEYLGMMPKDADKYRDYLGFWANKAIQIAGKEIIRRFQQSGRPMNDDEIIQVVVEISREVATHMRPLAKMDGVDYLSGAELDEQGRAIIMRNVRLLE